MEIFRTPRSGSDFHTSSNFQFDSDTSPSESSNDSESVETQSEQQGFSQFDVESATQSVFGALTVDRYSSSKQPIQILHQFATLSTRAATETADISAKEVVMEIDIWEQHDGPDDLTRFETRINGLGLTKDEIISLSNKGEEIDPRLSAAMHLLLSMFVLVGSNGQYRLQTRSRITGEETKGIVLDGGFAETERLSSVFSANEFGTQVEAVLDESINASQLVKHIRKVSEIARLPVILRTHESGEIMQESELTQTTLGSNAENFGFTYQHPSVVAFCHPSASGRLIRGDIALSSESLDRIYGLPIDIRLRPYISRVPVTDQRKSGFSEDISLDMLEMTGVSKAESRVVSKVRNEIQLQVLKYLRAIADWKTSTRLPSNALTTIRNHTTELTDPQSIVSKFEENSLDISEGMAKKIYDTLRTSMGDEGDSSITQSNLNSNSTLSESTESSLHMVSLYTGGGADYRHVESLDGLLSEISDQSDRKKKQLILTHLERVPKVFSRATDADIHVVACGSDFAELSDKSSHYSNIITFDEWSESVMKSTVVCGSSTEELSSLTSDSDTKLYVVCREKTHNLLRSLAQDYNCAEEPLVAQGDIDEYSSEQRYVLTPKQYLVALTKTGYHKTLINPSLGYLSSESLKEWSNMMGGDPEVLNNASIGEASCESIIRPLCINPITCVEEALRNLSDTSAWHREERYGAIKLLNGVDDNEFKEDQI